MVSADCSNESLVRRMPANKHQRIREKKSDKAPDTRSTLQATRQLPASHLLRTDSRSHNLNCSKFIYWRSRFLTPQELCWFQTRDLLKQPLTKFQPKVIVKNKTISRAISSNDFCSNFKQKLRYFWLGPVTTTLLYLSTPVHVPYSCLPLLFQRRIIVVKLDNFVEMKILLYLNRK